MRATIDPDQTYSRLPWFNPVLYTFPAALVILISGIFYLSPIISVFLPHPNSNGGYGASHPLEVRTLTYEEMIAARAFLPFGFVLGVLSGLVKNFLLRSTRSANFINWSAAMMSLGAGLAFDIALPFTKNWVICDLQNSGAAWTNLLKERYPGGCSDKSRRISGTKK